MRKNIKIIKSFIKNEDGNVLIMTAASILILFALAGAGLDLGRIYLVKNKTQQAIDLAALSSAFLSDDTGNKDEVELKKEESAIRYYKLNFPSTYIGVDREDPTVVFNNKLIKVNSGSVNIKTDFIKNISESINVSESAEVNTDTTKTQQKYDVALVLDNSDSMKQAFDSNKGCKPPVKCRIDVLRQAATDLAKSLLDKKENPDSNNRMAAVTWYLQVNAAQDFTSEYDVFKNFLDTKMVTHNGTDSSVGMKYAMDKFAPEFREDAIHAIILLTDGLNTAKNANLNTLTVCSEFKYMNPAVEVFTIAVSVDGANNPRVKQLLSQCASGNPDSNLGSYFFVAPDEQALRDIFQVIAREIKKIRLVN